MGEIDHLSKLWIFVLVMFILCAVMWIVYVSLRHVRNSIVLGSSDVSSAQYDDIELVAASESDRRHH